MTRVLLKLLAVFLALIGGAMVLLNLYFVWFAVRHEPIPRLRVQPEQIAPAVYLFAAVACALGSYMIYSSVRHLLRPNAVTTREVVSFGLYMLCFWLISPFLWRHPYLLLTTVTGLLAIRHIVVKRLSSQSAAGQSTP